MRERRVKTKTRLGMVEKGRQGRKEKVREGEARGREVGKRGKREG